MKILLTVVASILLAGPQTLRWEKGAPGMDTIVRDGAEELSIAKDGLVVSASVRKMNWDYLNKNHMVQVSIKNGGTERVLIEPAAVQLIDVRKNKFVGQVDVDRLVRMHGNAPGSAWSQYFGLNQSAEALKAQNTGGWLIATALKANTVLPGEQKTGVVWFKQDGNDLIVRITVNAAVYDFPFHF